MKKNLLVILMLTLFSTNAYTLHPNGTVNADVNGLVCDFCARAIEKVFKKQDAVESIDVNLDDKVITIHFNQGKSLEETAIIKMIRDSGYDVRGLRYE